MNAINDDILIEVKGLKTHFFTDEGVSPAVDGVDYSVKRGETLGVVGESGCGKSVTALSILRLIPDPPGKIVAGDIRFEGKSLLKLTPNEMRKIRGNKISMIFQEPMTSLNPVLTVGSQIAEAVYYHMGVGQAAAKARSLELMDLVKIPAPESRYNDYPHHLSGGMCQRIMIAMSLACEPDLVFADEPTTALDVTIQAQMLYLLHELKERQQMSMVFITHDLGVVAHVADQVAVMYAGTIVESAAVKELFGNPSHPYTRALLSSIPRLDRDNSDLSPIQGMVPAIDAMPGGCRFFDRCPRKTDCRPDELPRLLPLKNNPGHLVRCLLCE